MHDIRWIRENADIFDARLKARGLGPAAAGVVEHDKALRAAQTAFQTAQAKRNEVSKQIGVLKRHGQDAAALMAEVERIKVEISSFEDAERAHEAALETMLSDIPNLPADDVPPGAGEEDNVEVRRHGAPPSFAHKPKEHYELGEGLKLMDFERAAKLSGSRFVVLSGALARLERALGAFMLDVHTGEFGYTEISPPMLVRPTALYGTGQLPKFGDDLFRVSEDFWLVPTAEVPLTNLVADEILDEASLPRRYTAWTGCFRAEAGAAGRDTRGMLRQHQFYKVELVSICHPGRSDEELERMTGCAEAILKRLGLHFRTVVLCAGDMGFSARKTYDIEVWLPGQERFREISSCSNCGEFQARRMKARFRSAGEKGTRFVHTLNGSGIAVGRALVAIM
ncbi:MAG: serine--tRNA ligase, partial [Alphaproteobacteria bacterium]